MQTPADNIRGPVASINQGTTVGTSSTVDGTGASWQDEGFIRAVIQFGTVSAGGATAWLEVSDDDVTYVALDTDLGLTANTLDASWANADDNVVRVIEVDTQMLDADKTYVRVSVANGDGTTPSEAAAYMEFHSIKNTQFKDRTAADVGLYLDGGQTITVTASTV